MRHFLPIWGLALLLVPLWGGDALALPAETWVISVGNDRGASGDTPLRYATQDARSMARVLQTVSGVKSRRVTLLLNEDAQDFRETVADINARIRESSSEDSALVVYYSGHADAAALHLGDTDLPLRELKALVKGSAATFRLLVLDACRSGEVTRAKGMKPADSFPVVELEAQAEAKGFAVITSSAADEISHESERLRGSFFSHHWVNALRGAADTDLDGRVSLEEAYGYAYQETVRSSGRTQSLQHPSYEFDLAGSGKLVLASRTRDQSLGHVKLRNAPSYLVQSTQSSSSIAEVAPKVAGTVLALAPGSYSIQERFPDEYYEYEVDVRAGQTLSLEEADANREAYDRLVRKGGGDRSYVHGIALGYGIQSQLIPGEGPIQNVGVEYGTDFEEISLTVRLRFGSTLEQTTNQDIQRSQRQLGLAVGVQRFVDLSWISLGFGLNVEGARSWQVFGSDVAQTDNRAGWLGAFGGILAAERHFGSGFSLKLEVGPSAYLFRRLRVDPRGGQEREEWATQLSGVSSIFLKRRW